MPAFSFFEKATGFGFCVHNHEPRDIAAQNQVRDIEIVTHPNCYAWCDLSFGNLPVTDSEQYKRPGVSNDITVLPDKVKQFRVRRHQIYQQKIHSNQPVELTRKSVSLFERAYPWASWVLVNVMAMPWEVP